VGDAKPKAKEVMYKGKRPKNLKAKASAGESGLTGYFIKYYATINSISLGFPRLYITRFPSPVHTQQLCLCVGCPVPLEQSNIAPLRPFRRRLLVLTRIVDLFATFFYLSTTTGPDLVAQPWCIIVPMNPAVVVDADHALVVKQPRSSRFPFKDTSFSVGFDPLLDRVGVQIKPPGQS
jgi:hypothetical protein